MAKTEETWMDGKKIREAIEAFQGQVNWLKRIDDKDCEEACRCCIEYFETAIKALEKQLPKKVIDKSLVKDNDIVVGAVGRCPCCNEIIDDAVIVCDCNQKIDWSE